MQFATFVQFYHVFSVCNFAPVAVLRTVIEVTLSAFCRNRIITIELSGDHLRYTPVMLIFVINAFLCPTALRALQIDASFAQNNILIYLSYRHQLPQQAGWFEWMDKRYHISTISKFYFIWDIHNIFWNITYMTYVLIFIQDVTP